MQFHSEASLFSCFEDNLLPRPQHTPMVLSFSQTLVPYQDNNHIALELTYFSHLKQSESWKAEENMQTISVT